MESKNIGNNDKYLKVQKCYHELTKALEDYVLSTVPLDHAAEVLAREYRRHRDEVRGIQTGLLSSSACDEDQNNKDFNRAIEELKK